MQRYGHEVVELDDSGPSAWHEPYSTTTPLTSPPTDQFERINRWLSSVPRDDMSILRQTNEYLDFVQAFERLGQAHRTMISMNRSSMSVDEEAALFGSNHSYSDGRYDPDLSGPRYRHVHRLDLTEGSRQTSSSLPAVAVVAAPASLQHQQPSLQHSAHSTNTLTMHIPNNFLQQLSADDVILRVFEFLECKSLIRTSLTCSRFYQLAQRSAAQRTQDVVDVRQLNNVMMLLRAKEQIEGVQCSMLDRHVRVPMLLLHRRVVVSNAGDAEYNGVYFCTGCNGNGFVFSKPRIPEQRIRRADHTRGYLQRTASSGLMRPNAMADFVNIDPLVRAAMNAQAAIGDNGTAPPFESEVAPPGKLLRCIISKRFSNETILWYLSKEVEATETQGGIRAGEITQCFSYWSKLMVNTDVSPDICRYPSQSSILARHNEAWQTLLTGRAAVTPTVELLD